ncbi:MAG: aquaporin [Bacilli bacterium]|nr:aquaporin [Bacilli bacterium]
MKKYIAEFVGTMLLTLLACGVAVILGCNTVAGIIGTSLAFGLVIIAAAYSIGNISGCHINPAVTIAMLVAGKIEVKESIFYIISQILGALFGSLFLAWCLGSFEALGANGFGGTIGNGTIVTAGIAILVETILTFVFTTTILGVTDKKENGHATGIVIGLTLTLVHLFGIPFTGTSVNPARSLAPAILQGADALGQVWVFLLAPIIGAIIAGLFYKYVTKTSK